ncbi:unnamed protein product, partial [Gadus morhua 'NCC']
MRLPSRSRLTTGHGGEQYPSKMVSFSGPDLNPSSPLHPPQPRARRGLHEQQDEMDRASR